MERFTITKTLGDGSFGSVLQAVNKKTNEIIAVKQMKQKYKSWDECMQLREIKSLRKLHHTNIIRLKEVIRENDQLFLLFEFMHGNLYQLMEHRKNHGRLFTDYQVSFMMKQIMQGLYYMHTNGFFHRDMKPENVLISLKANEVTDDIFNNLLLKIADFGLAREIRSLPPYTDYVSTRWYRAPELLLRSTNYSSPVDIWASGAIMFELYALRPLFSGQSEIDQLFKICSTLGSPIEENNEWKDGIQLANKMGFKFPQMSPSNISSQLSSASTAGVKLLQEMVQWDPSKRPSSQQVLNDSFFNFESPNNKIQPQIMQQFTPTLQQSSGSPSSQQPIISEEPINNKKYLIASDLHASPTRLTIPTPYTQSPAQARSYEPALAESKTMMSSIFNTLNSDLNDNIYAYQVKKEPSISFLTPNTKRLKQEEQRETTVQKVDDVSDLIREISKELGKDNYTSRKEEISSEAKKLPQWLTRERNSPVLQTVLETNSPSSKLPKYEWFQSDEYVNVSIFQKQLTKEQVEVEFAESNLTVNISLEPGRNWTLDIDLLEAIVPSECKFTILSTKVEIKLKKFRVGYQWKTLEKVNTDVDVSSKKPVTKNWDKIAVDDEKAQGEQAVNELFQQIYSNGSDEVKRAMMKSFIESGGTCLSTDWNEVGSKKVEVKPPEGMEVRRWES